MQLIFVSHYNRPEVGWGRSLYVVSSHKDCQITHLVMLAEVTALAGVRMGGLPTTSSRQLLQFCSYPLQHHQSSAPPSLAAFGSTNPRRQASRCASGSRSAKRWAAWVVLLQQAGQMLAPMQLHCIFERVCIIRKSLLMLSLLAAVRQRQPHERQSLHCPALTTKQAAMAEATASIARLWLPKSGTRTQLSCACTTGFKLAADF